MRAVDVGGWLGVETDRQGRIAVGADLSTDAVTKRSYYRVDVSVPAESRAELAGQELRPGMPAEALIETGSGTALSYLLKPLSGKINRAFRD